LSEAAYNVNLFLRNPKIHDLIGNLLTHINRMDFEVS